MFGIINSLAKATVGAVVQTPASMVADVLTLGGSLTDKDKPYTAEALRQVLENLQKATK